MPLDSLFSQFLDKEHPEAKQALEVKEYIDKLQESWDKISDKVFREIEKTSGIKWKKEEFVCYVVKDSLFSISKPLILKMSNNLENARLVIVHELVHRNLNSEKHNDYLRLLQAKLKDRLQITKRHVIVNLVLLRVVPKLFGKTCFKRMLKKDCKLRDYAEAWKLAFEINELDGENIWKKIEEYAVELF